MKKELLSFIKKAKQSAYASESSAAKKGDDGGKSYRLEESNLIYTDEYFGDLVDCGQERIYENSAAWKKEMRVDGSRCGFIQTLRQQFRLSHLRLRPGYAAEGVQGEGKSGGIKS